MKRVYDQPPLSREEQYALVAKARNGDDDAFKALVQSHLPLVARIAAQTDCGLEREVRYQEGARGLAVAVKRFDPAKGNMLASYAEAWIRKFIYRAGLEEGNLTEEDLRKWGLLTRTEERLWAEHAREHSCEELAAATDVTLEDVERLNAHFGQARARLASEGHADGVDVPSPEEERPDKLAERGDNITFVRNMMAKLNGEERQVLTWLHGMAGEPKHTIQQIAARLGCTQWAAGQLRDQATLRLSRLMGKELRYR